VKSIPHLYVLLGGYNRDYRQAADPKVPAGRGFLALRGKNGDFAAYISRDADTSASVLSEEWAEPAPCNANPAISAA
jgi:hypothetical protein